VKETEKKEALKDFDDLAQACLEVENEIESGKSKKKNVETNSTDLEAVEELMWQDFTCEKTEERERIEENVKKSAEVLISHLNQYGACIIDDFLGEFRGNQVLEEVTKLKGLRDGELASSSLGREGRSIRSDKIIWTDGQKPPCPGIRHLVKLLDSIIFSANRSFDSGMLADYSITGRTKAMVACYPGGGSHYVPHVDNPKNDGRCITAIYYLNKEWNSEVDGGLLKIYSKCVDGVVAEIRPHFDRMIFFWSDRRNPHEVTPAFRKRFAVTVWYMDMVERAEYEKRQSQLQNSGT